MDYDERIQNLTQQIDMASRDVIIQDRVLGQARERVAELQGRINMLVELQETFVTEKEPTPAGRPEQPKPEGTKTNARILLEAKGKSKVIKKLNKKYPPLKKPGPKPGPVPGTTSKYSQDVIDYIKEFYPTTRRKKLVERLNIKFSLDLSESKVADIIRSHGLMKRSRKKKDEGVDPDEAFDDGVDELDPDD